MRPAALRLSLLVPGLSGAALALLLPAGGRAELPLPTFPECGEPDRPDLCPNDLGESWELISYVRADQRAETRPAELEAGSGMWVDRAFRLTTGDTRVILAMGDSGLDWSNGNIRRKFFLNRGELPLPQAPDGTPAEDHDANGDTVFNVDDYIGDPRVDLTAGVDRGDGVLDPSDLIAAFSDGVDDDGNGYADDISGWDFFGRDNDAYHTFADGYGTHGDGVAEDFGSEGGDGGKIGVCPNCMILPVRVGDTFITDGPRVAEAIVFAADSGASAMSLAIGALSNPGEVAQASRYAFAHGLSLVAAAGDENAYHHNFPAVLPEMLYVHSIRDSGGGQPFSWTNTWNCNNYGSRLDVVAPSGACATGAVANITGMVGLIRSAALAAGTSPPLHAGEVRQLVNMTADDINLPEADRAISNAYPSAEGWDAFFGYGRVNAARAVEAVFADQIPPWLELDGPAWFDVVDPRDTPTLALRGQLHAERSASFSYVVELGLGDDPRSWSEVGSGSGSGVYDGVLAEIDLSSIPWTPPALPDRDEGIMERLARVNQSEVHVRVRVTDAEGRVGELRRSFFVDADPDRLPGFPYALGASGESSPQLADLTGDGVFEVIIAGTDGRVHALSGDGQLLPGWPVRTDVQGGLHEGSAAFASGAVSPVHDGVMGTVAIGDIDGDGAPEVVAATIQGQLYAWDSAGALKPGFPYLTIGREPGEFSTAFTYDQGFLGAPTLYDLDGDGALEIIAPAMDSRLYVVDGAGADWGAFPLDICYPELCGVEGRRIIASAAVGDVDGDGDIEIGFGTNEAPNDGRNCVSYLVDADTASVVEGWPVLQFGLVNEAVLLPMLGEGHPAAMAFADVDLDGDLEISSPIMFGTDGLLDHTGAEVLPVSFFGEGFGVNNGVNGDMMPAFVQFATNPSFGDMNGDGAPDYLLGGASTISLVALAVSEWVDFQQPVGAWSGADGSYLPGWPRQIEDMQFLLAPAVADISGDGVPEAIYASAGYIVHAWDQQGAQPAGWPKFTGQWVLGSPAVGDIDGDGYLDVVVSTREGYLFAWSTRGPADAPVEWASQHHDPQNTGNYEVELPVQEGPPPEDDEVADTDDGKGEPGGCCDSRGPGGRAAWLVVPLSALMLARRRGSLRLG
jgi:hypothetical protein